VRALAAKPTVPLMTRFFLGATLFSALLAVLAPAPAAAQAPPAPSGSTGQAPPPAPSASTAGPTIELAPEHDPNKGSPQPPTPPTFGIGAGTAPDAELMRGLIQQRFRSAAASTTNTSIGGYGEIHVKGTKSGREGKREWQADVARLVLFVAHQFTDNIRIYTELEVEHAISCKTCVGAIELEQAYADWKVLGDKLGLRAGLVLVPMGVINQWHEPPIFHGVVRPRVETVVIPSTWREIGGGFFGQPTGWLRYELYGMTGLDPAGFGAGGLANGRQNGGFAKAKAFAITGRVEVEPVLGAIVGVSGYGSNVGPNGDFYDAAGKSVNLTLPVIGWSADARYRQHGIEWKVVYAEWHMPQSAAQMAAYDSSGNRIGDPQKPVPTLIRGGYVEAAYDVLKPFGLSHQLLPFIRLEGYDTQAQVPDGYEANPTLNIRELTFGLSYRPIQQVVVKADYQLRNKSLGLDQTQINFGVGFMY
jgi:hypothetical protein